MKALVRGESEVILEPFSPWVEKNIPYLTERDGWTLVDPYEPPIETPVEETPEQDD